MPLRYTSENTLVDDLFDASNLGAYLSLHGGAVERPLTYSDYYRFYSPILAQGTALAEYYLKDSNIIDGSIAVNVRFPDVTGSKTGRSRLILSVNNVLSATSGVAQRLNAEVVYRGRDGLSFELTFTDATHTRTVLYSQPIPLVINTSAKYTVLYENRGSFHFLKVYPINYPTLNWDVTLDANAIQAAEAYKISTIGAFVFGMEGDDIVFAPKIYRLEFTNLAIGSLPTYDDVVVSPPVIAEFYADPDIVQAGTDTDLRWSVTNATEVTINNQRVSATGRMAVFPDGPTTYTMIAKNDKGSVSRVVKAYTVTADTDAFPVDTGTDGGTTTPTPPTSTPGGVGNPSPTEAAVLIDASKGVWKDTSPSPASPLVLGIGRNHTEDFWTKTYYAGPAMDAQITAWARELTTNWGSERWGRNTYLWRNGHSPTDGKAWRIGGLEQEMYGYIFTKHWGRTGGYPYDDLRYALNDAVKYGTPATPWSQMHVINYGTGGGGDQSWFPSFNAPDDFAEGTVNTAAQRFIAEAANYVGYCNNKNHPLRVQYPTFDPNQPPVKFFEMGNEIPGNWERGNNRASTIPKYAFNAAKAAEAMRAASPTPIEIGFVASSSGNWNGEAPGFNQSNPRVVAEQLLINGGRQMDAFILHPYNKNQYPVQGGQQGFLAVSTWQEFVWRTMVWPLFEKYAAMYNRSEPWKLWMTEFYYNDFANVPIEENWHWRGTLYHADLICTAINNNWPIVTLFSFFNKKDEQKHNQMFRYGTILTGSYKLQKQMSKSWGDWNVNCATTNVGTWFNPTKDSEVTKHGYPTQIANFTAASSISRDGRYMYVMLVNRTDAAQTFQFQIRGFVPKGVALESTYTRPSMTSLSYDPTNNDATGFVDKTVDLGSRGFSYTLAPRAITFLKLESNGGPIIINPNPDPTTPGGGDTSSGTPPKSLPSVNGKYAPPSGVCYFGSYAQTASDTTSTTTGMSQWNLDPISWKQDIDKWALISGKKPMLFRNQLAWQDIYNGGGRLSDINAKYSIYDIHPILSFGLKDQLSLEGAELFSFSELVLGTTRDEEITAMANFMKQLARPIFLVPFPSANNAANAYCPFNVDETPRAWNTTDFKLVWRKIYNLFQQAGAHNVAFVWRATPTFTGVFAAQNYYPGDEYVDWVSTFITVEPDAVTTGHPAPTLWTTNRPKLVEFIGRSEWQAKPIMLDFGLRRDAVPSATSYDDRILDFFNLVRTTPRIKSLVYLNTDNTVDGIEMKLGFGTPASLRNPENLGDPRFRESYTEESSQGGGSLGNNYVKFDLSASTRAQFQSVSMPIVVSLYAGAIAALMTLTGQKVGRAEPFVIKEEGTALDVVRYIPAASTSAPGRIVINVVQAASLISRLNTTAAHLGLLKGIGQGALDWQRYNYTTDTMVWSLSAQDALATILAIYGVLFTGNVQIYNGSETFNDTYAFRARLINSAIAVCKSGKSIDQSINTQVSGDNSQSSDLLTGALLDLVNLTSWTVLQKVFVAYQSRVTLEYGDSLSADKMELFFKQWCLESGINLIPRLKAWGFTPTEAFETDPTIQALPLSAATLPDPVVSDGGVPGGGTLGWSLRGTIREHGSGAKIAGVTVIVGDRVTKTGLDGQYQLSGLPEGRVQVLLSKDGWVLSPNSVSIAISSQTPPFDATGYFDGSATPRITGTDPTSVVMGGVLTVLGSNFNADDKASNKVFFDSASEDGKLVEGTVMEATGVKLKVVVPNGIKSGFLKLSVAGRVSPDTPYVTIVETVGVISTDDYTPTLTVTLRSQASYSVIKTNAPFSVKPYIASPSREPYSHTIDWGDGTHSTVPDPVVSETRSGNKESGLYSHTYERPGTYLVRLTTTDSLDPAQTAEDVLQVHVVDDDSYQIRGLWSKLPRWLGSRF